MEFESRTKQISLPDYFQDPCRTPTHTPTPHHFSCGGGRSSTLRSSLDTPLSSYLASRGKHPPQEEQQQQQQRRGKDTVQLPLSALSPPTAHPGSVGGVFNSTTKVKCVPLPTIYNKNQQTLRGVRNIRLLSDRYLPNRRNRTVSDSLLHLPKIHKRQQDHLLERESGLKRSKSLKKFGEIIPHRVEGSFYMSGHGAQMFDRQDFTAEELKLLESMSLAQNSDLYYGKGLGGGRKLASSAVKQFEVKIKKATERVQNERLLDEVIVDAGRYSRASQAVTPGPTIPEEETSEGNSNVFVTESQQASR